MKHTLHIQLSSCEGAVLRAIGLIERRGFSLDSCSVSEADGDTRSMEISVISSRPGDLLKRQLERLHDVLQVELQAAAVIHPQSAVVRPVIRRQ